MRILCVNDDPVIHELFERSLEKLELPDLQYLSTASGEDAVAIVTGSPVDLVLLDNMLPDIPGIEVLSRIKAIQPDTEVLMITGNVPVADAVTAMKAGARDYIEKPFHADLLCEKVYNLAEYIRRNREAEDYRFAKEVVENGAGREISSLEEAICTMKECQSRVVAIIDSDRSDAGKLEEIRREIIDYSGRCR